MNPRLKKILLFVLKIAVLGGILEYARRQSQLDDEIAVPADNTPGMELLVARGTVTGQGPDRRVLLHGVDGRTVPVMPGARLRAIDNASSVAPPLLYRARTADGSEVDFDASDLEGSLAAPAVAGTQRPAFALLPGLRSLFQNLDLGSLGWGFALFGPALFLMAVRWRLLLVASGIQIPFFTLVRLHYLGFFFNTFMPGGAGGDIIKAVYVTRHSAQKATAATVVLIDRLVGVVGLLLMAGCVILADYKNMHGIALQVGALSILLTVGAILFFSAPFRKLIRYDAILGRLPRAEVIRKVDSTLYGLRRQKSGLLSALALTVVLQLLEVIGVWFAGNALGLTRARFVHYLAFVPIGYLVNAVPISFGGIGLMEGAYLKLFRDAGVATATQGFMLGLLSRLIVVAWSLLGALSLLFPPQHAGSGDLERPEGTEREVPGNT